MTAPRLARPSNSSKVVTRTLRAERRRARSQRNVDKCYRWGCSSSYSDAG